MNQNQFDNFGEPNYTSFVQGDNSPTKTVDLVGQARASFVRKVYSVLCVQLLITVMMTALSMTSPAFFLFQLSNVWLFYVSIVVCLVIEIYMFCCQGGRTFPENFICLGLFTLAEAYVVSFMCSETGMQSGNHVVLLAGVYTLGRSFPIQSSSSPVLSTQPIPNPTSPPPTGSSWYLELL
jgi:FtsH-binding integral membrane protein